MQQLAASFGIPQYLPVLMVSGSTQELLVPQPRVLAPSPREIIDFQNSGIEIYKEDKWLEGVSRSYPVEQLEQARFILGAQQLPDGSWVGTNTYPRYIDINRLIDYRVLVATRRNR